MQKKTATVIRVLAKLILDSCFRRNDESLSFQTWFGILDSVSQHGMTTFVLNL